MKERERGKGTNDLYEILFSDGWRCDIVSPVGLYITSHATNTKRARGSACLFRYTRRCDPTSIAYVKPRSLHFLCISWTLPSSYFDRLFPVGEQGACSSMKRDTFVMRNHLRPHYTKALRIYTREKKNSQRSGS